MKIENLKEGDTFKNYKELCSILKVPTKNGNSKISQLKQFGSFVKYRKEGHKFIIEKIYKFPKKIVDGRYTSGSNSIYTGQIQALILDLLSRQENKRLQLISITKLLKSIEMVNPNYDRGDYAIDKLHKRTEIDKKYIYDFYSETQRTLKRHIDTALRILQKKEVLRYEVGVAVAVIELTESEEEYENHRRATREEREFIFEQELIVLKTIGAENRQQVFISGKWRLFRKEVEKLLRKSSNILYYYNCYDIIHNESAVIKEMRKMESEGLKNELNDKIINQLNNACESRNTKAKEKTSKNPDKIDELRSSDEYCSNNKRLIEDTVKRIK